MHKFLKGFNYKHKPLKLVFLWHADKLTCRKQGHDASSCSLLQPGALPVCQDYIPHDPQVAIVPMHFSGIWFKEGCALPKPRSRWSRPFATCLAEALSRPSGNSAPSRLQDGAIKVVPLFGSAPEPPPKSPALLPAGWTALLGLGAFPPSLSEQTAREGFCSHLEGERWPGSRSRLSGPWTCLQLLQALAGPASVAFGLPGDGYGYVLPEKPFLSPSPSPAGSVCPPEMRPKDGTGCEVWLRGGHTMLSLCSRR